MDDPDIKITFKNNRVSILNGCNTQGSSYKAYQNGTVNFGSFFGTLIFCQIDYDNIYVNALASAVSYV